MAAKNAGGLNRVIQSVSRFFTNPAGPLTTPTRFSYKNPADVPAMATGFRPLDKALGIGGLPYGRIVELIGPNITPNSGGAASIAARIAAKVQRQQEVVTIIDMDHSFDTWQAERCGLIAPQLLLARPETLFETVTALENAAKNADLVIVMMGIVAELLRDLEPDPLLTFLRRLQRIVRNTNTVFLFVTSPYENDPFDPANYPPGFPLAQLAALRLWVQNENWTHKDGLVTAYKATLTVIKNDLAMPGKGADVKIKLQ